PPPPSFYPLSLHDALPILCPWEAVATGNVLARVFPALNSFQLYTVGGGAIYLPRLAVGLALTVLVAFVNYRGIDPSGLFQDVIRSEEHTSELQSPYDLVCR